MPCVASPAWDATWRAMSRPPTPAQTARAPAPAGHEAATRGDGLDGGHDARQHGNHGDGVRPRGASPPDRFQDGRLVSRRHARRPHALGPDPRSREAIGAPGSAADAPPTEPRPGPARCRPPRAAGSAVGRGPRPPWGRHPASMAC